MRTVALRWSRPLAWHPNIFTTHLAIQISKYLHSQISKYLGIQIFKYLLDEKVDGHWKCNVWNSWCEVLWYSQLKRGGAVYRKVGQDKKLGIELSGVSFPHTPSSPLGIINWSVNQFLINYQWRWRIIDDGDNDSAGDDLVYLLVYYTQAWADLH